MIAGNLQGEAVKTSRKSLRQVRAENVQSMRNMALMYGDPTPEGQKFLDETAAAIKPRRETGPRGAPEHDMQVKVIYWWRKNHESYKLPEMCLFAIPNGGARDPIIGARMKAEGVRSGVYDLMLAVPKGHYHGLFIEMKAGHNTPSEGQIEFGHHCTRMGYANCVQWSDINAIDTIKKYLAQ